MHPALVAMHILLLERGFLCLYVHQCMSLLPASPCAGEKELHGLQAVGSSAPAPHPGRIQDMMAVGCILAASEPGIKLLC